MERINSFTALAAILSVLFYILTKDGFVVMMIIQGINAIITCTRYIQHFGFDCTE